jgi:glycosyltransferase involved in cell wall biosynthesis
MQITFLIRSLSYGGAQRQVIALANGLAKRGHAVCVVVYYPGGELEGRLNLAVPLHVLYKRRRWDFASFYTNLHVRFREEKPDIVYSFLASANVLSVSLKPFIPDMRVVWGKRSALRHPSNHDVFERIVLWMERRLARYSDLIIYNSWENRKASLKLGFPDGKSYVIPNGFDLEYFCPDQRARTGLRSEWGIAADERLIGVVGRLDPIKDHPTFLRAAGLLLKSIPRLRFVCVGDGDRVYKRKLQSMADDLGLREHLLWAGFRSDMPAVYNALDVLVSASQGEAFPNVIGEAMACGTPCVATNVGDSACLIGDAGRVVSPGDPHAIANALIDILEQSPINIRPMIPAYIAENFSLDRFVEDSEKLLIKLMEI